MAYDLVKIPKPNKAMPTVEAGATYFPLSMKEVVLMSETMWLIEPLNIRRVYAADNIRRPQ
jgi:hypothetical protein